MRSPYIVIKWRIDEETPIEGIAGVDPELVPVEDLVRWAKRRKKQLRRDIRRGYVVAERREREAAEKLERQAAKA